MSPQRLRRLKLKIDMMTAEGLEEAAAYLIFADIYENHDDPQYRRAKPKGWFELFGAFDLQYEARNAKTILVYRTPRVYTALEHEPLNGNLKSLNLSCSLHSTSPGLRVWLTKPHAYTPRRVLLPQRWGQGIRCGIPTARNLVLAMTILATFKRDPKPRTI